jgi:monoamine oxidase
VVDCRTASSVGTGFLEEPEANTLFAEEHNSTHSQGYLNGGVETGERAARQVLNLLG